MSWLRTLSGRRPTTPTLLVFLISGIAACSGQSCSCLSQIPGGFPVAEERPNGVQTRFSSSFMTYASQNAATIAPNILPTMFAVPPSCTGSDTICCGTPQPTCNLSVTATGLTLTPQAPDSLHFVADLVVKSLQNIPVSASIGSCVMSIDTTRSGNAYLTATGDLTLPVDGTTKLTALTLVNPVIDGIDDDDVNLDESGSDAVCAIADLSLVKGFIIDDITGQVGDVVSAAVKDEFCQKCGSVSDCPKAATACTMGQCIGADGTSCIQELGIQGEVNAGSFLASYVPGAHATMDIYEAAGGYATADTGLSVGIVGGALSAPHDACVPVVAAPTVVDIPQSASFAGDVVPGTTTPYHVGVGVHASHLDRLGYAYWDGGGLCLGIGTAQTQSLDATSVGLIMPSLTALLHASDAPVLLQLRPQNPPTFTLGAGTFKTVGSMRVVDQPLVTLTAKAFSMDFYLFLDDRYVRIATLTSDLALPLGLDTDATGGFVILAGDFSKSFSNITVTNTELLKDSPANIALMAPLLLTTALDKLVAFFPVFHLPTLAGLAFAPKVITSTDPDTNGVPQFLAIYADVMSANTAHLGAETDAQLLGVRTPPTEVFDVAHRDGSVPAVKVAVQGEAEGRPFEWSWAFDGGAWHAYQTATELELTDETLWLQGKHTVAIRGRAVGDPASLDGSPVVLPFIIDSVAPTGDFTIEGGQIVAHAHDAITADAQLRYLVGAGELRTGNVLGPATSTPPEVYVFDEAGNSSRLYERASTPAAAVSGGCDVGGHGQTGLPLALLVVAALLLRRRLLLVLLVGACHHSHPGTTTTPTSDQLDPTDQIGRMHDTRLQNGLISITAYDQTTGDLAYTQVATHALSGALVWTLVDGIDPSSTVDPTVKYRGGHTDPGPDVGYYSALSLTGNGDPRIAYWDATNHALKFASGPYPFSTYVIDSGASDGSIDVGLYPTIIHDDEDVPTIAYAAFGMGDAKSGFSSELRLAVASSSTPKSATDWTISVVDTVAISCGGRCGSGSACIITPMVNGMANTDPVLSTCLAIDLAPCPTACDAGDVCIGGACTTPVPASTVGDLPEGTGLFSQLVLGPQMQRALAYYDRSHHELRVATGTGGKLLPATIDGTDTGDDYGQHVSAAFASDGTLHLAYVDGLANQLDYRSISPSGAPSARAIVDDGLRADGYHPVGASASLLLNGSTISILYQDQATSDLELASGPTPWSHADFLTGASGYGFSSHQVTDGTSRFYTTFVIDRTATPLGHIEIGTMP